MLISSIVFFSACTGPFSISGVPVRLLANFTADAGGSRPNALLPGDPSGDQIIFTGDGGVSNPQVVDESGQKWLRVTNSRYGSSARGDGRMKFRGTSVTYPTGLNYSWKTRIIVPFLYGSFTVNLTDGAGTDHVSLRLEDYRIAPDQNPNFGYLYLMPSREFLGKIPVGQVCAFYVTIDKNTNSYSLTVTRPTFPDGDLRLNNRPLAVNLGTGAKNPSIEIQNNFDPPEFTTGSTLVNPTEGILFLDDFMIQAN